MARAKKRTRKPARKAARKPARKAARKPARKAARKPARKAANIDELPEIDFSFFDVKRYMEKAENIPDTDVSPEEIVG